MSRKGTIPPRQATAEGACWILGAMVLLWPLLGRAALGASPTTNPATTSDPAMLVAVALDGGRSILDRIAAAQKICGLTAPAKEASLLKLLAGDDSMRSMAVAELIRSGSTKVGPAISAGFPQWQDNSKSAVFETTIQTPDAVKNNPVLLDLARAELREAKPVSLVTFPSTFPSDATRPSTLTTDNRADLGAKIKSALGPIYASASWVVMAYGNADDQALVEKCARYMPQSVRIWKALLVKGRVPYGADTLHAATAEMERKSDPMLYRMMAAGVLAKSGDLAASKFVWDQETAFRAKYFDSDGLALGQAAMRGQKDGLEYLYFLAATPCIGILAELPDPKAEREMVALLASRNISIRMTAGMILARRWPDDLINAGQGSFTDGEYVGVIAEIALRHPELAKKVSGKVPASDLQAAEASLKSAGPAAFPAPGLIDTTPP